MQVPGYNVAYVGNIAFEAGEADLRELMRDCTVTKVRMHTDKATGRFKGYAHIHFADEESLDRWAILCSPPANSCVVLRLAPPHCGMLSAAQLATPSSAGTCWPFLLNW